MAAFLAPAALLLPARAASAQVPAAVESVLTQFERTNIVVLAEHHHGPQAHDFILALIANPRFPANAIVVEVGSGHYERFGRIVRARNAHLPRNRQIRLLQGTEGDERELVANGRKALLIVGAQRQLWQGTPDLTRYSIWITPPSAGLAMSLGLDSGVGFYRVRGTSLLRRSGRIPLTDALLYLGADPTYFDTAPVLMRNGTAPVRPIDPRTEAQLPREPLHFRTVGTN